MVEFNNQYEKEIYEICIMHKKSYPQILRSKKYTYLWNYILTCTQVLQQKEIELKHKYKISTYVNWTLKHRTEFGVCKTCGKVFYLHDLWLDGEYPAYCCMVCMNKSPDHVKKVGDTLETRYGVRVPAKHPLVIEKTQKTCLRLYGVNCVMNQSWVHEKLRSPELIARRLEKLKEYNNAHYGVDWFVQSDEFKRKTRSIGGVSKEEKQIVTWLKTIVDETDIAIGTFKVIPPRQLDIFIIGRCIGIEFNGTYYHSIEHNMDVNYHLMKTKMCEDANVKLIHIWEDEWLYENEKTKNFILSMVNNTVQFDDYAVYREDYLYEIDRAKFNRCCIPQNFAIIGETQPEIILRAKSEKEKYKVANCGKLILKRV